MKKLKLLKCGTVVQSVYRARWHGVVLGVHSTSKYKGETYACYDVLAMESVDGRKHRKPAIHVLSDGWLIPSTRQLTIPDNFLKIYTCIDTEQCYDDV